MNDTLLVTSTNRTIDSFYNEAISQNNIFMDNSHYGGIDIHLLAHEFVKFFELKYPLDLIQIFNICHNSGFIIEASFYDYKKDSRGWNFVYNNETIRIEYNENDPPCGQIYTILHELYEVIERKISKSVFGNKKKNRKTIDRCADQFSAFVSVPDYIVFDFIKEKSIDVFGLKNRISSSYMTALIRLHDILADIKDTNTNRHIPIISLLYERAYWKDTLRTPKLQIRCFKKNKGFGFSLKKKNIKDLVFIENPDHIDVPDLQYSIKTITKARSDIFFHNICLIIPDIVIENIDLLIRPVIWKGYPYPMKVLIQIIPSKYTYLYDLANKLNIEPSDFNQTINLLNKNKKGFFYNN